MKQVKKYQITTLQQLTDLITEENFMNLSLDFFAWLTYHKNLVVKLKETHPEYKDKKASEILTSTFVWLDDGKSGEIKKVTTHNTTTGEIKEIKLKKK